MTKKKLRMTPLYVTLRALAEGSPSFLSFRGA